MQRIKRNIVAVIAFAAGFAANAQPTWIADASHCQYKYQNSMTIIAQLHIDGEISVDNSDMIGLFCGEECRGAALNNYLYGGQIYTLITVYGNDKDRLTVKIYDASSGTTFDLKQYFYFNKDSIIGGLQPDAEPFVFYSNLNEKKLKASNFVTPNADGKNDYFVVEAQDLISVKDMMFKVFTLKGEEVYQQKDYDNTWNGQSQNGKDLPQGTYYYLFVDDKGKTVYKGSITLVR